MRTYTTRGGATMPVLGQGTWRMGESASNRKAEVAALKLGFDLGMTLVDTAEMYADGGAEIVVGEAIAGVRDKVFVVSKVLPQNASRQGTIDACERSLKRLKIDCLDLYLLHWPGSHPFKETLEAFAALKAQGKINHFGVSNFDIGEMRDSEKLPHGTAVVTNQVLYNLHRRGIERNVLPFCAKNKIALMAYSPFDQSGLTVKPELKAVAARHKVSAETIALAWTLRFAHVIAIPKATNPAHVRQNAQAAKIKLSQEDLAQLDKAYPPPKRTVPLETA